MRIDLKKCKSDPERLLARVLNEIPPDEWPNGWTVKPQAKVKAFEETKDRRYVDYDLRVDFLFSSWPTEEEPLEPFVQLAVECDSRAYHDLKPEQIERDRWRDRKLAGDGIFVLRYSAKEIMRNPKDIAEDILGTLEGLIDCLGPVRYLVDWSAPVDGIERYKRLVTAALRRMKARLLKR